MKKTYRLVKCPHCGTQVHAIGKPGEKRVLTCPNCHNNAVLRFPETTQKHTTSPKTFIPRKQHVIKRTALCALLAIILLVSLAYIVIPIMQGSTHFLVVLSGSMQPTMNPGDVVVSSYVNPGEIQANDIITFADPNNEDNCVTHRVIRTVTSEDGTIYFVTKGDANEDPDIEPIHEKHLIGKVRMVIPYLGYLPFFAKTPLGFLILIIAPGTLVIINEVWHIIQNERKKPVISGRGTT